MQGMDTIKGPHPPSLSHAKTPERPTAMVCCMSYKHIPTAVGTINKAFENDPFHEYLYDTPDSYRGVVFALSRTVETVTMWIVFVAMGQAWTVDNGDAVVAYLPAKNSLSVVRKILVFVIGCVLSLQAFLILSKEQQKRGQELRQRHRKAMREAFGEDANEMINLQLLATTPAKQGRGYASALVRTVLVLADTQGRATFLTSSNLQNIRFYESLGFIQKTKLVLGDSNSTWSKAPITLSIMAREPKSEVVQLNL